jgi:hypothetical protein
MEGALQLAVSNRLPSTRTGPDPRSGIGGYRDVAAGRLLSCEVVNERLIRKRRRAWPEMQESPCFPAELTRDGADGTLPQKRILTEMPQI